MLTYADVCGKQGHGIWFAERALGTLDGCTVDGSAGAGVLVEAGRYADVC
jgi:hypothetical protein